MDRNTPTTIKLRKDIDGIEWPADWDFSYRGADLIAERAAVRFFERYSFDRMNRRLFSMVKSTIAIAMTEAQEEYYWPVGQTWMAPNGTVYKILKIDFASGDLRLRCVSDGTEGIVNWNSTKDWKLVEKVQS